MKRDWVAILCYTCIIISITIVATYIILNKVHECTSDPLNYAVEKIKSQTDVKSVSGKITVQTQKNNFISDTFGDNYFYIGNKTNLFNITQ